MTAKTYRLPDALGGGECVLVGQPRADGLYWRVQVGTFTIDLLRSLLTEIEPSLPEEPPIGSFVAIDGGNILQRRASAGIDWWDYGVGTWWTWAQVCALGTPIRLVPDPFAEPVELPWVLKFDDGSVGVARSSASNRAAYVEGWAHLSAVDARIMARALMAAADAVERAS